MNRNKRVVVWVGEFCTGLKMSSSGVLYGGVYRFQILTYYPFKNMGLKERIDICFLEPYSDKERKKKKNERNYFNYRDPEVVISVVLSDRSISLVCVS